LKKRTNKQSFIANDFTNGEFKTIFYKDIDLVDTEALLKKQGLLVVELKWPRAYTLIALLKQEDKYVSNIKRRQNLFFRLISYFELIYLIPLILFNSNISLLHCIYVNNRHTAEWKKLKNGYYQFVLM
jgi:hypothetical protein